MNIENFTPPPTPPKGGNTLESRQHDLVLASLENRSGTIILNNPSRLNCLSHRLMEELMDALGALEQHGASVIIIRAAPGARVWSAGHDINELPAPRRDPLSYSDPLEMLLRSVQDCPVPVIAMVEGSVWGGACDLCCSCDMVIASDTATFAMTPAKIGIPYNPSGLMHFVNHIGLNKAKEMFFTAQPVSAQEAHNNGFVNDIVPGEQLESFTSKRAGHIAANAPLAVRAIKAQFRLLTRGALIDAETAERIQAIRRSVYDSEDYAEGIRAFKEKRPPQFKGK
ncbi:MAG: methylmalonyl-CoA decarboxylase [Puniceicoccales bacterium]|jgi:methylmalonyl-CoA decarboxylase|nr:methylmalonyl-CoA decarboxylase [Puniceicoccales bacterium]